MQIRHSNKTYNTILSAIYKTLIFQTLQSLIINHNPTIINDSDPITLEKPAKPPQMHPKTTKNTVFEHLAFLAFRFELFFKFVFRKRK